MEYIRGFFILFVLLTILVYLVPGNSFQKYIRFFTEVILTFAFLSPILSLFCDSDAFMELIQYESFTESLSEISKDTQRIEFLQNDYYIRKYEIAIAEDVKLIAETEGYSVREADVGLTEDYVIDSISLTVTEEAADDIFVGKIEIAEAVEQEDTFAKLKEKLAGYYQIEESRIVICKA